MIMKIGRNDMCSCGSNIKYKKCCLPKEYLIKKQVDDFMKLQSNYGNNCDVVNDIKRTDITNDDFIDGNEILYVVDMKNLPNEISDKVNNLLDTKIFYEKLCWVNSTTISLNIDGVEKVDGWYGFKFGKDVPKREKEYHFSLFHKVGELDNGFHLMKCSVDDYVEIWDMKNKDNPTRWDRHSWNRYNGIDFDITPYLMRKNWEEDINECLLNWVEYREFNTHKDIKEIDNHITQSILDIHHHPIYETMGRVRRLN